MEAWRHILLDAKGPTRPTGHVLMEAHTMTKFLSSWWESGWPPSWPLRKASGLQLSRLWQSCRDRHACADTDRAAYLKALKAVKRPRRWVDAKIALNATNPLAA